MYKLKSLLKIYYCLFTIGKMLHHLYGWNVDVTSAAPDFTMGRVTSQPWPLSQDRLCTHPLKALLSGVKGCARIFTGCWQTFPH